MDGPAGRGRRQRQVKPGTRALREELQRIFELKGWTDITAAEACSDPARGWTITDSTINNYRHGYELVSRAKMPMIERGFGISVRRQLELMDLDGDDGPEREPTMEELLFDAERALRRARELYARTSEPQGAH